MIENKIKRNDSMLYWLGKVNFGWLFRSVCGGGRNDENLPSQQKPSDAEDQDECAAENLGGVPIRSMCMQKVLWCASELNVSFERIDAGQKFGVIDTPNGRHRDLRSCLSLVLDAAGASAVAASRGVVQAHL
jgi:hypothetical protein